MEPSVNLNFRWNKKARAYIDDHEIEKDSIDDLRDSLLTWETTMLEYALDPKFHSLAPMLHQMGRQIKPEYAFIDKGPPKDLPPRSDEAYPSSIHPRDDGPD